MDDLLWMCGYFLACAIFLGGAAKDTEMMTYALVHRNPLVTESVPKFRPEVHMNMSVYHLISIRVNRYQHVERTRTVVSLPMTL